VRAPPHKRDVGMVFQNYALFPHMDVAGNIAFPLRMRRVAKADMARKVAQALELVQLGGFGTRRVSELSGGQRQRVGIARALAVEPDVLLMDEPFSALDPVMTDELHDDVLRIWEQTKKTVVMVSHQFEEAVLLADRVGVMMDGRLEEIVEVNLPRPRREDEQAFMAEVRKLRGFLASPLSRRS